MALMRFGLAALAVLALCGTAQAEWRDFIGKTLATTLEGTLTIVTSETPILFVSNVEFLMAADGILTVRFGKSTLDGQAMPDPTPENRDAYLIDLNAMAGSGKSGNQTYSYTVTDAGGVITMTLVGSDPTLKTGGTITVKFGPSGDCAAGIDAKDIYSAMVINSTTCELRDTAA